MKFLVYMLTILLLAQFSTAALIKLDESNSYEDVLDGGSLYLEDDKVPLLTNGVSLFCGPCNAKEGEGVDSIGGGPVLCGYDKQTPLNLLYNNETICVVTPTTQYELQLVSWFVKETCYDVTQGLDCASIGPYVSYDRVEAEVSGTLVLSDLELGSSSQLRSNTELDEEDSDYYIETSGTFTIHNTDVIPATQVKITWPTERKYNITLLEGGEAVEHGVLIDSIPANSEITVSVSARVPEDHPGIDLDADDPQLERAVSIGELKLEADRNLQSSSEITLEARNMLIIDRLTVSFPGDSDTYDDGDEIKDVEPGVKVTFQLQAESRFKDSSEIEIDNVEFRLVVDDGDLDEDEDVSIKDLKPGATASGTITLELDDDIEEDDYKIEISLLGEDEFGAEHGEVWELTLNVAKEDEKIEITSIELAPNTLSNCDGESSRLFIEIQNKGSDRSDEVVLVAVNDKLNLFNRVLNIELDENNQYDRTFTVDVPAGTRAGTYQIDIWTYFDFDNYDDDSPNSFASTDLRVTACAVTEQKKTVIDQVITEETKVVKEDDSATVNKKDSNETAPQVISEEQSTAFQESNGKEQDYVALKLVVLGALLLVIITLAVLLFKNR
ncbi:hypothetical protein H6504_05460 [Candidatus Woesearchaeota archaeon]|nr:hypothetical protein [Candidatus Woesearchaeota archaeon]